MESSLRSIALTGALGNVGFKVLEHLAAHGRAERVVALDAKPPTADQIQAIRRAGQQRNRVVHVEFVQCDLLDYHDRRWRQVFDESHAVLHFAARFPFPESGWADADASFMMTLHTAQVAARSPSIERYVFASSNHVMGRYKDRGLGPGQLSPDLEPGVGTVWHTGEALMDSTPYATARWAGERVCQALAVQSVEKPRFVCVRIGWCQPGENRPETLSGTGTPHENREATLDAANAAAADLWFRRMWLSNRDCCQLFQRAVEADASAWPSPCLIVNGMSNNRGMPWNLDSARRHLGYQPRDDAFANSS